MVCSYDAIFVCNKLRANRGLGDKRSIIIVNNTFQYEFYS